MRAVRVINVSCPLFRDRLEPRSPSRNLIRSDRSDLETLPVMPERHLSYAYTWYISELCFVLKLVSFFVCCIVLLNGDCCHNVGLELLSVALFLLSPPFLRRNPKLLCYP